MSVPVCMSVLRSESNGIVEKKNGIKGQRRYDPCDLMTD